MAIKKLQAIKFNHTHLLGIQYLSIPEVNLILDESLAFVDLNRNRKQKVKNFKWKDPNQYVF